MRKLAYALFIALIAALLGGALFVFAAMKKPLGAPLALEGAPAAAPQEDSRPAPQAQKKTCGQTGQINLLVMGLGHVDDAPSYGSDTIRLVYVDYDKPGVRVLAVPRELWVDTPALAEAGVQAAELKWIYPHASEMVKGNPQKVKMEKGTQVFAQTLLDNFGYAADHYLTLDEPTGASMVDTLGGVEVVFPAELDGRPYNYELFPAGAQHLSGEQVLDSLRVIHLSRGVPTGWESRFQLQDLLIQSLVAAAKQPANWSRIDDLAKDFRKLVATDLSVDQLLSLVCMVEETAGEVEMLEISEEMTTAGPDGQRLPDLEAIQELLAQFQE